MIYCIRCRHVLHETLRAWFNICSFHIASMCLLWFNALITCSIMFSMIWHIAIDRHHSFPLYFNKMPSPHWSKAAPQHDAAPTITSQWMMFFLRCRKCHIWLRDSGLTSSISVTSVCTIIAKVTINVCSTWFCRRNGFFVPPSHVGHCYSKLLMCAGSFDVMFTSW